MSNGPTPEAVEMSQAFYADPTNYDEFTKTPDDRYIIGCIDPRFPAGISSGQYMIMKQTSGAGVGESLDAAHALTAEEGRLVSLAQGLVRDEFSRPNLVYGVHPECRLIAGVVDVLDEIEIPSDRTMGNARRWSAELDFLDIFDSNVGRIGVAAAMQAEYIRGRGDMDHLIPLIDRTFPSHANVIPPLGANTAKVYVLNLHPDVGINKGLIEPDHLHDVQAYHDSLAATLGGLDNIRGMSKDILALRGTSMVLRAAAVQTVLTDATKDTMTFLEVRRTSEGIKIEEQPA